MNPISRWFWKRAVRREMLSLARLVSLAAGLLLIVSGLIGGSSLLLGLILGVGIIIFSGRLKHRVWSGVFMVAGIVAFASLGGSEGEWGAILLVVAAGIGFASSFV